MQRPLFVVILLSLLAPTAWGQALTDPEKRLHSVMKAEKFPAPELCRVVVDDVTGMGFRISDGQALIEATMRHFRHRLSRDEVVFEGNLNAAKKMKRMLGGNTDELTEMKAAYYKEAIVQAKHRVHIKFGKKKGKHWIRLTCHKNAGFTSKGKRKKPSKALETLKVTHSSFSKAKAELVEKLPAFCPVIQGRPKPKPQKQPGMSAAERRRQQRLKKWTPPARR